MPDCIYPMGGAISLEHQRDFSRLLEILEVDVDRLQPIYHPTQFENIILPDGSFSAGSGFTEEYRETIDRLRDFAKKNRTTTSSKKLYFFYGTSQTGEERLAEYFKSKGYEIISHAQRIDLDAELNMLINCESFVSTLGSCAHNSLFLPDNAETILIPRAANRFTGFQQVVDQVHPINANYIDSSLSIFETFNGPYCFIISEQLKKFFGDTFDGYEEDDFKVFLTYVRNSAGRGFKLNEKAVQYYAPIYFPFLNQLSGRKDLLQAYGINLV